MRKSVAVVVLALALSAVSTPGALATVKAGATCKKAGLKSIAAGKQFTCVKVSGKLVWNKGVAVKASAKPSAKASATPSAKASATATNRPTTSATPIASTPATTKPSSAPSAAATVAAGYTMAQVEANKTRTKCWSAISGNVYDLTSWINVHPGGSGAIVSLCGTDGTQEFLAMHRNQSKPESRLASYLLGPLTK